jgi:integrase
MHDAAFQWARRSATTAGRMVGAATVLAGWLEAQPCFDAGAAPDARSRSEYFNRSRVHDVGRLARKPNGPHQRLAARQCGHRPAHLHALRHTHASSLIAAGVDILTISRRLGHANPKITLDVYGHLYGNTDDKAAVEAMFARIGTE